jgi:hypothetical protein
LLYLYAKLGKERRVTTLPVSIVFASSVSISVSGLVGIVSCGGVISSVPGIRVRIVVPGRSISIAGICIVAVLISLALVSIRTIASGGCGGGSGRRIEGCGNQSC